MERLRHLLGSLIKCRDTLEHLRRRFEVGGDHISQQVLIHLLLVVETVLLHQTFEVRHEHASHLNLEASNSFRGIVRRPLLALFLLLDGLRRRLLLFLGHGLPLQSRGPIYPAMSVVSAGAPDCLGASL